MMACSDSIHFLTVYGRDMIFTIKQMYKVAVVRNTLRPFINPMHRIRKCICLPHLLICWTFTSISCFLFASFVCPIHFLPNTMCIWPKFFFLLFENAPSIEQNILDLEKQLLHVPKSFTSIIRSRDRID